jgi:hypothetical protein
MVIERWGTLNQLIFRVIPAKAGIHIHRPVSMDAGFRRHDTLQQIYDSTTPPRRSRD